MDRIGNKIKQILHVNMYVSPKMPIPIVVGMENITQNYCMYFDQILHV